MKNPRLLTSFLGDWCHQLDQKDIAVIVDSEYRSPAIIDEGIILTTRVTKCQPSTSLFTYVHSVPAGAIATVLIHLAN